MRKKVEFATIVLRKAQDSLFVDGTITDSTGRFEFNNVKDGRYLICVSYVGYKSQLISVDVEGKKCESLNIHLELDNIMLSGAEVRFSRPILSKKNNLLIMNIENTVLENFFSTTDVLSYIPGVIIGSNGVSLIGKGSVLVLIDNRIVSSMSELDHLNVKSIKNISVEKNAGVKFDSKYRSIIIINTKKIRQIPLNLVIVQNLEGSIRIRKTWG